MRFVHGHGAPIARGQPGLEESLNWGVRIHVDPPDSMASFFDIRSPPVYRASGGA